jgi:transcription elongation factor GreA
MNTVVAGIGEHETILTRKGYERLRDELAALSTVSRADIDDRVRDARSHGGELSDNPDLIDALEDQELLMRRIARLEAALASASVVDDPPKDRIGIGTHVRVRDADSGRTTEYELVGSIEADPDRRKLSAESPVGRALLGRRAGTVVDVEAPRGTMRIEILDVRGPAFGLRAAA